MPWYGFTKTMHAAPAAVLLSIKKGTKRALRLSLIERQAEATDVSLSFSSLGIGNVRLMFLQGQKA